MKNRIGIIVFALLALCLAFLVFKAKHKGFNPFSRVTNHSVSGQVCKAQAEQGNGQYLAAKEAYLKLVNLYPNSKEVINWQQQIDALNIKLIFSPTVVSGSALYEIKPGDTLVGIAKEFNSTVELIMKANNISGSTIQPSRKVKVQTVSFSVVVDKSQNILLLKAGDEVIKTYIVSTGANNSTPVGNFKIVNKLPNPTWFKAGAVVPADSPDNILGTRWMGIDVPGYGIHGTTQPQELGKQITQGCVRMANPDVEELYMLLPVGAEVVILD